MLTAFRSGGAGERRGSLKWRRTFVDFCEEQKMGNVSPYLLHLRKEAEDCAAKGSYYLLTTF